MQKALGVLLMVAGVVILSYSLFTAWCFHKHGEVEVEAAREKAMQDNHVN